MKHPQFHTLHLLIPAVLAALCAACASIGRPQGGPRDETPPVFVSANPLPGALNFTNQRLDLFFDENIQLEDAFNKVIVSPVQKNTPQVSANGKHLRVELKDTLMPDMTYTIDFGDAIKDLNEGNVLDGFATCFSTGQTIDTLRIAGIVLDARTLEPAQGILVGVYSNLADTAISTLPFERIARTNQYGQFTLLNLKDSDYRIFALNDMNRDYHWDRSEDIAFYDIPVRPYTREIEVTDTLRSYENTDSLVTRTGTAYFPNDVLLTWFNEGYQSLYLKDYSRPERRRLLLNMSAPADSLPEITVASGAFQGRPSESWARLNSNRTLDSLEYWISDPDIIAVDSLYLSVRYQRTDTADQLVWKADTLKFFFRDPKVKQKKKNEEADTLPPPPDFLKLSAVTQNTHEVFMPLVIRADQPIDTIVPDMVRLELQQDSLWLPITGVTFTVDSLNPLQNRRMHVDWRPGEHYRLTVDSAAVTGLYGNFNNTFTHEFNVRKLEDYSSLVLNVSGQDSLPMVVELLDNQDKVIRTAPVVDGSATIPYINPGTYYARLFIDANNNGEWDTGNLLAGAQPEEVYYYPKKLNLRRNWDVAQSWSIYDVALDLQKPYDIKKNKPKLKKGEKDLRNNEDEDEEEDEFGNGMMRDNQGYTGNAYDNARRRNNY